MAGPGIFNRTRIPLDADEPIPEATENTWKSKDAAGKPVPAAPKTPNTVSMANTAQEPPTTHHGAGKAKARKVGKPPEDLGPPKPERRICMVALRASGAGQESCNQDYRYCGLHQGKPMFKASNGAVIYFNKFWKMNKIYKTTGWIYCVKDSSGCWPSEGRWSSEGTSDPNGAGRPPSLVLIDEPLPRQVAEESTAYILEDGQKVLKREENKSWRWNEVLVRSKEDILRSLLEPREERPSGLVPGFLEPKEDSPVDSPPPAPAPPAAPKAVPVQRAAAKAKDPRPPVASVAPECAPEPRAPAPEPRPERPQRRGAAPEVSERPERFNGASARRFRPSSSTRESLAMAVAERKQRAMAVKQLEEHPPVAELPRQRDPPEAPPDEDQDTAEMMVGGNVFRVRRVEQGTEASVPPSLQSMLAYLDAEDAQGYPPEPLKEAAPPKPQKADCPQGPAADWSLEEVSRYLNFLGLGHIEEKFKENAVDGAMLVELSEEDLCKELGLLKLQAKKLLSRLPRDNLPTAG